MCNFIGWPSTLNSSSRKGPMLATVEANSSAWKSCILISRKPKDSAIAECRAADGPISARMHIAGVLLLPCLLCSSGTAKKKKNVQLSAFFLWIDAALSNHVFSPILWNISTSSWLIITIFAEDFHGYQERDLNNNVGPLTLVLWFWGLNYCRDCH